MKQDYFVENNGDDVSLEIDAPGLKPDDINVSLKDRFLEINGTNAKRSLFKSYELGFVPKEVEAKLDYGVLNLKLVKPDSIKPKQIPVICS